MGGNMVVLVRCLDKTCAPALESCLDELISRGEISAFLRNGVWIDVAHRQEEYEMPTKRTVPRVTAMVACF